MKDSDTVVFDDSIPIQFDLFGKELEIIEQRKRIPKHKMPSLVDDVFETPDDNYYDIISDVKLLGEQPPELDVFAMHDRGDGKSNSKCVDYLTEEYDSLSNDWLLPNGKVPVSVWINDLHSRHEECMVQATSQYEKYGFTMVYLIPSNTRRTRYWKRLIEPYRFGGNPRYHSIPKHIHNFPFEGTFTFLKNGKPTVNEDVTSDNFGKPQTSRNGYEVLVWCSRLKL